MRGISGYAWPGNTTEPSSAFPNTFWDKAGSTYTSMPQDCLMNGMDWLTVHAISPWVSDILWFI